MNHLKTILLAVLFVAARILGAPIAHYTFNDPTNRYKDVSGNGYHGTEDGSGTTFVSSGVSGLGDAMDSSTSGRMLINTPFTIGLDDFTISFWAQGGTDWDYYISFGGTDIGGTDNFNIQKEGNVSTRFFLENKGEVSGYTSYDVTGNLSGEGMTHIVLSANSENEIATFYVNGSLAVTGAWTVSASETMGYLSIGGSRSVDGTTRNIDAIIDDVQIYDTALSSTDASYLYDNMGIVIPEPATVNMIAIAIAASAIGLFISRRFVD